MPIKIFILSGVACVGAAITSLLGGWNGAMTTLVILMLVDYVTGLIVAGVFHASPKSSGGALSSAVGFKGICRKFVILLIVVVACRVDLLLDTNIIRDATCIGFCVNELVSITENAGLMGIPLPRKLVEAIEVLRGDNDNV
ncbi:MAG: holin family protein [Muribaculaceae bacterium]